ncbi:MAG: transketolase [Coxiella sp. (in: Bacteria)]|nr:MAG: transketolase [Coxiella sp. (in: g-proteobacteria)]
MTDPRHLANAIRFLSIDAVQKANSGHPGMPMGMADIATVLWRDFIRVNPGNPQWYNRDRFVLSNGHGAMLLYSLLHLTGFDLSIDDLKNFRQLHSKTPGHPELLHTPGVETTTGPLGQGLANAVGMALAEQHLAAEFNRDDLLIVDHHTYAFIGDGCLMEGVSHESCSLAGHMGLGKLIVFWDDNGISIDGKVEGWFTTDTPERFKAYNWQVIENIDGHDDKSISKALKKAQSDTSRPTLICCKTSIGFGAPNLAGSEKAHGSPLGDDEIKATREQLDWPHAPFEIPDDVYKAWDLRAQGQDNELMWNHLFTQYESDHPALAKEFLRRMQGWLPEGWGEKAAAFVTNTLSFDKAEATRKSSQHTLNGLAPLLPEILGGSADLTGSNCTNWSACQVLDKSNLAGNYIHYGVREFGMSAVMNGLSLHGGLIPFGGTFLVFSDYARNALRMAAIMRQRVIYVFSHDSIGLGEDGPTHQPVEQAASLRLIPNMHVWRPADRTETAVAWRASLQRKDGPAALLLSRQGLPQQPHSEAQLGDIAKGGYVVFDQPQPLDGLFIATGSEVQLAVTAAQELHNDGINVRVVSMPCCEVFLQQGREYRDTILPPDVRMRVAVEAGVTTGWYQFVGTDGAVVGIDQFGISAPAKDAFTEFGFTVAHVKEVIRDILQRQTIETL